MDSPPGTEKTSIFEPLQDEEKARPLPVCQPAELCEIFSPTPCSFFFASAVFMGFKKATS